MVDALRALDAVDPIGPLRTRDELARIIDGRADHVEDRANVEEGERCDAALLLGTVARGVDDIERPTRVERVADGDEHLRIALRARREGVARRGIEKPVDLGEGEAQLVSLREAGVVEQREAGDVEDDGIDLGKGNTLRE